LVHCAKTNLATLLSLKPFLCRREAGVGWSGGRCAELDPAPEVRRRGRRWFGIETYICTALIRLWRLRYLPLFSPAGWPDWANYCIHIGRLFSFRCSLKITIIAQF
jgi:hypothetical protein